MAIPYRDNGVIDGFKIEKAFEGFINIHKTIIERVQGRGNNVKWGATQNFGMGKNYGQILGLLHHVPLTFVIPQTWQKKVHKNVKGLTPKERSASAFASLNPSFGEMKKSMNGLVDAFLIARWALDEARIVFFDDWNFIDMEDES
jgi:hypothetical protein